MSLGTIGRSNYTKIVKELISRISDSTAEVGSLYEQAQQWFLQAEQQKKQRLELEQQVQVLQQRQSQSHSSKKEQQLLERHLQDMQGQYKNAVQQQQQENLQRYDYLKSICDDILTLCQGDSFTETNQLSAKLLGTIQLLSPTQGKLVALNNQHAKHLYKAVLSLRLLDRLLLDQELHHAFIQPRYASEQVTSSAAKANRAFRDDVQTALLMAILLQDIGSMHPAAQHILRGATSNADPFRVLDNDERTALLQISFRESLNYVNHAIGCGRYIGNSKEEREQFNHNEQEKQAFIITLLKNAVKPEHGIGNLLKIPQIYTSVVLSTKSSYSYETLPKAALVLEKGAEKGIYSQKAVNALLKITGIFPQGFGITYIPKDSDRQDMDRYEYAIVTSLYPADLRVPICRMVTRNLTYNVSAQGCTVSVENNLYFPHARKKLEKISEDRLLEILSKLVSNFDERKNIPLVPACWHPGEYFSYIKNQNLWNKVIVLPN